MKADKIKTELIAVRVDERLYNFLTGVADYHGVDLSSLVRVMFSYCIGESGKSNMVLETEFIDYLNMCKRFSV